MYRVKQREPCWSEESVGRNGVRYIRWAKCSKAQRSCWHLRRTGCLGWGRGNKVHGNLRPGSSEYFWLSTSGWESALARPGKAVFEHLCAVFKLFPVPTCTLVRRPDRLKETEEPQDKIGFSKSKWLKYHCWVFI